MCHRSRIGLDTLIEQRHVEDRDSSGAFRADHAIIAGSAAERVVGAFYRHGAGAAVGATAATYFGPRVFILASVFSSSAYFAQ